MKKQIFENCVNIGMPVHRFRNNTNAIFYKGFKFEEITDTNGNITYKCYNIRYMKYKELTQEEMKMVVENGVILSSDVLSYQSYKKIIAKYLSVLSNNRNGYKSMEKAKKVVDHYDKICNNLLNIHKKHADLFVE
jgi:hypothetical protein